ncbi:MAG: gamma-glutamylcyclotransferase [Chitinophagaceae bacterium]|nr:gamma-glutamylcyclotransferase [Chitinophagaceae bacterium]MCW5904431.1 gamma-glutamylcyclotransferase [Chitinophagaceae bacterium]
MQPTYFIFIYGSLRSGFSQPAYNYISKYFNLVAKEAKVKGILYNMGDYPVAKSTQENKFLKGELYCIKNNDEFSFAIAQLDGYEGVRMEDNELPLFVRTTTTVYFNNESVEAWVYWYNGNVTGRPIIECGDVIQFFIEQQKGS